MLPIQRMLDFAAANKISGKYTEKNSSNHPKE
jgi:hypothetical protein